MTFTSAIIVTALAASSSVHAQQVNPAEALNRATQTLAAVTTAPSPAAEQIARLRTDFADFASLYLAGPGAPPTGTAGAVGTTGRSDAPGDWRTKYQRVEGDLAALLGPVGGGASGVTLDPETRARLDAVRSHLQMFYAATMNQADGNPIAHTGAPQTSSSGASAATRPPVAPTGEAPQTTGTQSTGTQPTGTQPTGTEPPGTQSTGTQPTGTQTTGTQPTPPAGGSASPSGGTRPSGTSASGSASPPPANRTSQVDTEWGTALAMLDRVERILNDAIKEPGKVNIDRASIDEIRAEIAQIRTMLSAAIKH